MQREDMRNDSCLIGNGDEQLMCETAPCNGVKQMLAQCKDVTPRLLAFPDGILDCLGKGTSARYVGCPAAHACLLASPVNEGRDARASTQVEGADALGSANLVSRKRAGIHTACLEVERQLSERLNGIAYEESPMFVGNASKLRNGLNGTQLVIDLLNADEAARIARILDCRKQTLECGRVYDAIGVWHEPIDLVTSGFERISCVKHRMMLDCRDNDVRMRSSCNRFCKPLDSHVVSLGATRSEDDLGGRMRSERTGYAGARIAQLRSRFATLGIECVGVCPAGIMQHGIQALVEGSGRGVVKIDAMGASGRHRGCLSMPLPGHPHRRWRFPPRARQRRRHVRAAPCQHRCLRRPR